MGNCKINKNINCTYFGSCNSCKYYKRRSTKNKQRTGILKNVFN